MHSLIFQMLEYVRHVICMWAITAGVKEVVRAVLTLECLSA